MAAARVALGTIGLFFPGAASLKDKRQILKSLKDRVKHRFDISVAEVDHKDAWQRATLALACVSGDGRHANEVVDKAMDFLAAEVDGHVTDRSVEIW